MKRAPRRKPRASHGAVSTRPAEASADARIRVLLERYCRLAAVKHAANGLDGAELRLPESERGFFRDRERLNVASSVEALERDPDADLAVPGSPFLSQLVDAIRSRAARLSLGLIAAPATAGTAPRSQLAEEPTLIAIPVRNGTAKRMRARKAVHPIGRRIARVVLRAGAGVEEAVVESDVFDLSTGTKVSPDVAAAFRELEAGRVAAANPAAAGRARRVPPREPAELLRLLAGHLQEQLADRVAARRATAAQGLATELARLDRYFAAILGEESNAEAIATVTALAERRRAEEIRRSEVRAVVHPLQLIHAAVVMERAEWRLESAGGRSAKLSAQRVPGTASPWVIACPQCGRPPAQLVICRHDHAACDACSHRCSVCGADFCAGHGIAQCRVDGEPMCDEHVRVCPACRLEHCTAHEGVCAEDGHTACASCLAPCGSCGRVICNRHAEQSDAAAPKGTRRLCAACLRHCAGGVNEPVGVDELGECATCGKAVCAAHGTACAVDGQLHCSQHLRRTAESQRLVCARHLATCALEPLAVFAVDEVTECAVCGRVTCTRHRAACDHTSTATG